MSQPYHYTAYIWPLVTSVLFQAVIGWYAWRHRSAPGATPFALVALIGVGWALASTLELAGSDPATKFFWRRAQFICEPPIVAAMLWLVLDYADLRHWLRRRILALLFGTSIAWIPLILTNDAHHLVWTLMWADPREGVRVAIGALGWAMIAYGYAVIALTVLVLVQLFVHSPLHRKTTATLLVARLIGPIAYLFDILGVNPVAPMDATIVASNLGYALCALAIFRFHMLDLVPIARDTVIEQMNIGMMVIDAQRRIVDYNPIVSSLLGARATQPGSDGNQPIATAASDVLAQAYTTDIRHAEIAIETDAAPRWLDVESAPLTYAHGRRTGRIVLVRDVTEIKATQAQLVRQQRALAVLEERMRLARELHDTLAQTIASVRVQAEAAALLIERGEIAPVAASLGQIADAAQAAYVDLREYIFGVKAAPTAAEGLFVVLRRYLAQYSQSNAIPAELRVAPGLETWRADALVELHLLRIIQEALTNIRKHAGAQRAWVAFALSLDGVCVSIEDDGQGFDLARNADLAMQGFGLRSMHERAQAIGGRLTLISAPGRGTTVQVLIPLPAGERLQPTAPTYREREAAGMSV